MYVSTLRASSFWRSWRMHSMAVLSAMALIFLAASPYGCSNGLPNTGGELFRDGGAEPQEKEPAPTSTDGSTDDGDILGDISSPPSPQDAGPGGDSTPDQPNVPSVTWTNGVFWPPKEGLKAPAALPAAVAKRACPVGAQGEQLFQGQPCAESDGIVACIAKGCQPAQLPAKPATAPRDFFDNCSDKDVYCVGASRKFKTIQAAVDALDAKATIATIKIDAGRYAESVSVDNFAGKLVIQGVSSDRKEGTVLVAPARPNASDRYATLSIRGVKEVTIERLVVSGAGHGILVEDFIAVFIDNDHLVANEGAGLLLRGAPSGKATVTNNIIQFNGATSIPNNGTIGVFIDNDHRGVNPYGVFIDNDHRGVNPYGVFIDNDHRVLGRLQYGLLSEGVKELDISQNTIRNNGAGGVSASSNPIGVFIDNDHRVGIGDDIAVFIDNDHRVAMKGNRIAHNGPAGFVGYRSINAKGGCPGGLSSEGGFCFPSMLKQHKGNSAALGVGVAIAGVGQVSLEGNSIHGNDTIGLILHSVKSASLTANAVSRNGLRPKAVTTQQSATHLAGVAIWGVTETLDVQRNLILGHLADGVVISHGQSTTAKGALRLTLSQNHFASQGVFLPGTIKSLGNGLRLHATGAGIQMNDVIHNAFVRNRRAGMFSQGPVFGMIKENLFLQHARRALALTDLSQEVSNQNQVDIVGNVIDGATGYGIQIYTGKTAISVLSNRISSIFQLDGRTDDPFMEGDALNVGEMSGAPVKVEKNRFAHSKRAGCFFSGSDLRATDNEYDACANKLMQKAKTGEDMKNNAERAKPEMHNRKNFDEP